MRLCAYRLIFSFTFYFLIVSVGRSYAVVSAPDSLPTGKVIDTVCCKANTSQSYSLYLPSCFNPSKKYPVIYIFEPAARGSLPVKLFAPAAEEFGYIVVGSNNSRNGSWDVVFEAANAMFDDTHERFPIDTDRVYTSGFSGGSRSATSIAVMTKKVAGVIGCGAGFSPVKEFQPTAKDNFLYVGIVGNMDMNFLEHQHVERKLNKLKIPNRRIVFQGKHVWPPATEIMEAIHWLELQEIKISKDPVKIQKSYQYFLKRASNEEQQNNLYEAQRRYMYLKSDFTGLVDMEEVEARLSVLSASKALQKITKNKEKAIRKELKLQQMYLGAFTEMNFTRLQTQGDSTLKDESWWKVQIDFLKRQLKSKNIETILMAERLLNLIWASCAERSFRYLGTGDFDMAITLTRLWLYAEPKSVWAQWSMAKVYALNGNEEKALSSLEKAHQLGMSRPQSLTREKAFDSLKKHPRYTSLLGKLIEKE